MTRITKAPDERREELIAAAQELFFNKGYENTSVSEIVRSVGVAQGTFYYYFASKLAILEAMVAVLAEKRQVLVEDILDDESLNAVQKWTQAVRVIGDWEIERKAELLALARVIWKNENLLLRHKLRAQRSQRALPMVASIIAQGVEEGVFETDFVEETAEIVYAISRTFSGVLTDIWLNPDRSEDPANLARRKIAAAQAAIDRVLGAAPGSLPLVDEPTLAAWLAG